MKKNSESTAAAPAKEKSKPKELTKVDNLKREQIRLSSMNPRKTFDDEALKELAISISEQGLLQPITVRPIPDLLDSKMNQIYEVVCGARRFKALTLLDAKTVPCIIRELTDAEALDAMITENLQRKDVDPMEEAEAYKILTSQGQAVSDLSIRFGKSEKYIRGRMILTSLNAELSKAMQEGYLPLTAAIRLARITDEQQQSFYNTWLKNRCDKNDNAPHVSIVDVNRFLENMSQRLDSAIFLDQMEEKWNDHHLPICKNCLNNSASQHTLFPEMDKSPRCLNPQCYKNKIRAYQDWYLNQYYPNLLHKDGVPQAGDIVLGKGYAWDEEEKRRKEFVARYEKELAIIDIGRYSTIYSKDIKAKDCIRCIDLGALCRNQQPMIYLNPPKKQTKDKAQQSWELTSAIHNLHDRRDKQVTEVLEPLFKDTFSAYIESFPHQDYALPNVLTAVVAKALIKQMSWDMIRTLKLNSYDEIGSVMDWIHQHSLSELILAAAADLIEKGSITQKAGLLNYLMTTIAPDQTNQAINAIMTKSTEKENKLIAKLKELGYDEHGNKLKPETKSESK